MPYTPQGIKLTPTGGYTYAVTITTGVGSAVTAYDANGDAHTFPVDVTGSTESFFFERPGQYIVSATVGGEEVAGKNGGTATVTLTQGAVYAGSLSIDPEETAGASGSATTRAETLRTTKTGVLIDDFASVTGWVAALGSLARDTTDVEHPSALKVTTNSGATATATRSVSLDARGKFISFWVKPLDANLNGINIKLSVTNRAFSKMWTRGAVLGGITTGVSGWTAYEDRWHRVTVPMSALASNAGATTAELADVRAIRLEVQSATGTVAEALFADLRIHDDPYADAPGLIWIIDDAKSNTYDVAFPILQAAGIPAVTAVISGSVGTAGFMTLSQIQELVAAGWETAGHSNDSTQLTAKSAADITTALQASYDYLANNGLPRDMFVYPGGSYNAAILDETMRYFKVARSISNGSGSRHETPIVSDRSRLRTLYIVSTTTLASAKGMLDELADRGGVDTITFHNLVASPTSSDWSPTDFQALVDYAQTLGLRSYLPSEIYPDVPA